MAGATAVVTLAITLRALLLTVATLAQASSLLAVIRRALSSIIALAGPLLPLLLHEEQLAVYARWWQRIILLGTMLYRAQPSTGVFKHQLRQVLGNFNHDGHLGEMLGDDTQQLLNYLLSLDLLSQRAKCGDQAAETHGEVVDRLTLLEPDALKLNPQSLCPRVPDNLPVNL
jgi:hypothetical protein